MILHKGNISLYHDKFPLYSNPALLSIFHDGVGKNWARLEVGCLGKLFDYNGIISFERLQLIYKLPNQTLLKYYQIRDHFSRDLKLTNTTGSEVWDFIYDEVVKSMISKVYKWLGNYRIDDCEKLANQWSKVLVISVGVSTITQALGTIKEVVHSTNLRLQQYGTICLLYYTPERIAKWAANNIITDRMKCPRCDLHKADIKHMFVICPELTTYWQDVQNVLHEKLGLELPLTVGEIMLGRSNVGSKINGLLTILLVSARLTIAREWISPKPPNVMDWWLLVRQTYDMEQALAKSRSIRCVAKCNAIWGSWL